jgi:DNA-binding GntR family transcriptional regulator
MEARLDPTPDQLTLQPRLLKGTIFELLHARIIAGQYAAGEWLRQEDIATQLGVSMTPVREALDLLVSAGLAERIPYRGVRVLQLTPEEIADSYYLRLLLECSAARAAADAITQDQVEELHRLVEQMHGLVTLNDISSQRQLNRQFHMAIAAAAGMPLLTRTYETILNTFPDWMLYEYMFRHPELLASSLEQEYMEHLQIVQALAAHDTEQAEAQAANHIINRAGELETYLQIPAELLRRREQQVRTLLGLQNIPQTLPGASPAPSF